MISFDYLCFGSMVCWLQSNCYLWENFIQNFIFIYTGKCLAGYNVNYQTLLIIYVSSLMAANNRIFVLLCVNFHIKNAFYIASCFVTFHLSFCRVRFKSCGRILIWQESLTPITMILCYIYTQRHCGDIKRVTLASHQRTPFLILVWCLILLWNRRIKTEE